MKKRYFLLLVSAAACLTSLVHAEDSAAVPVSLEETLGQRRYGYPVRLDVPFPQGTVRGPEQLALEQAGKALTGVQYDALSSWPDGSLQWAMVCFNRSPGPLEREMLALRYGAGVTHGDSGGASVEDTPDVYVIRKTYRIPKADDSLVSSIRYGGKELLRSAGTWRIDGLELRDVPAQRKSRVIAAGAVNAVVERAGVLQSPSGEAIPYRVTFSQPNSKSWLDINLVLEKPLARDAAVEINLPYVIDRTPARYDFGVEGWVYGTLKANQQARLTAGSRGSWQIAHLDSAGGAASPIAAASPAQPRAEGWGHLIDGGSGGLAVAFGAPGFGDSDRAMADELIVSGDGLVRYRHTVPAGSPVRARLLVHHVGDPVHVTAVTSPSAMLHPLKVSLPGDWYLRCRAGKTPP